jgi:hypothetical protein
MLKRFIAFVLALGCVGFLATGCGTTAQTASGPNATLAKEYAALAETREQVRILVSARKITPDKAEEIRGQLRGAQGALDAYADGRQQDGLAVARGAVAAVRAYLISQGAQF